MIQRFGSEVAKYERMRPIQAEEEGRGLMLPSV